MQTQIDPSLAALIQTAQMVTPDQTPTVAAQVAQAAQQKLMPTAAPPGISALMPGVKQQAMNTAQAAQPVTQAQVQQMMQAQMNQQGQGAPGPRPSGVAGIPAQNMQRMQQMAGGGVVGYAGDDESYVRYTPAIEDARRRDDLPPSGIVSPGVSDVANRPSISAAFAEVEKQLPGSSTEQSRAALEELQRIRRARPDTGQMTSKALEEEAGIAAALKSKMDASAQERGIMAWLQGGEGRGASARSFGAFQQNENQRRMLQAQENTIRVGKMEAIKEANEARRIGDQEKYVESLNKLAELDRADKQIKATLAANVYGTEATIRGQDIQAQEAAANRAHQMELEKYRRQTQLMKPHEQLTIERLEKYKLNELTDGKPNTATPAQQAQALREAIQEARGGIRSTDFSRQYDIALQARLARGEPDNAETREAARRDVSPTGRRADLATRQAVQKRAAELLLAPEYRKIKDPTEARRQAEEAAARELGVSIEDVRTAPAAPAAGASAPRGTRDNPIKLG